MLGDFCDVCAICGVLQGVDFTVLFLSLQNVAGKNQKLKNQIGDVVDITVFYVQIRCQCSAENLVKMLTNYFNFV